MSDVNIFFLVASYEVDLQDEQLTSTTEASVVDKQKVIFVSFLFKAGVAFLSDLVAMKC